MTGVFKCDRPGAAVRNLEGLITPRPGPTRPMAIPFGVFNVDTYTTRRSGSPMTTNRFVGGDIAKGHLMGFARPKNPIPIRIRKYDHRRDRRRHKRDQQQYREYSNFSHINFDGISTIYSSLNHLLLSIVLINS